MTALEKIMQMKQQGLTEPQIIDTLKQEGVSPREIEEGLSQSNIKSAINMPQQTQQSGIMQPQAYPAQNPGIAEMNNQNIPMQPSISQANNPQQIPPEQATQPMQAMQQSLSPNQVTAQQPIQQYQEQPQMTYEQAPEQYYDEYSPQSLDIATINDIAEQIVEEKNASLKKQISTFTNFKEEISLEVEKLNERLNRIENIFNELQVAILKKIGEYGEGVQNIEKEMQLTQDSFSKIVNPLTDNIKELQKITGLKEKSKPKPETKKSKSRKKDKINFEDYLR